jgi:alpha-tubulin suppressor-like RCC1 family protein
LLTTDSQVYVWGLNSEGQLGVLHHEHLDTPVELVIPTDVCSLIPSCSPSLLRFLSFLGLLIFLVLIYLFVSLLPLLSFPPFPFTYFFPKEKIVRVHAGGRCSIVLTESGALWGWGENDRGQLGLGHLDPVLTPTRLSSSLPPIATLSCGWSHAIAIDTEGKLWGWGENADCQVLPSLNTTSTNIATPHMIPTPVTFSKVSCGTYHSLGLTEDGDLYSWGWNYYGQRGIEWDIGERNGEPRKVTSGVRDVAGGMSFTLVLKEDGGELWSCGRNQSGQCGVGTDRDVHGLSKIPGLNDVVMFGCGDSFSFAMTRSGDFFTWGDRDAGRLGRVADVDQHTPKILEGMLLKYPKSAYWEIWDKMAKWLFYGKSDRASLFFILPVEVIYNFVGVAYKY